MKINYQLLYQKLGNLFYAIADADNTVRKSEEEQLTEQLKQIWLPVEHSADEHGTSLAYYIFIAFDYLHGEGIRAEEAFRDFCDYYKLHEQYFDKPMKSRIMKTAEEIAKTFAGKNKLESAYLQRLRHLMQL